MPTSQSQPPSSTNVRALVANLFYLNQRRSALIDYVRRESPDMLVLFEVNPAWQRTLTELEDAYPYQLADYRRRGDGIALFSKREPLRAQLRQLGPSNRKTMVAIYADEDQEFTVIATHPFPPISARLSQVRDEQLQAVGELAAETAGPLLVMGDLNTSPWSPIFRQLARTSGLRDSRRGYGLQVTWTGARGGAVRTVSGE